MANVKNALLAVKNGEQIQNLFLQTTAHNVIVNKETGETLKQRLAAIAKQLGDSNLTVTEQVQEVKAQFEELIGEAPENLNSIHEIADFLQTHESDFETLKTVADGIHEALEGKIGDLGEFATVTEYVEAQIEAAAAAEKVRCEAAIALEKARAEAAEDALATAIGENKAAIEAEVARATEAEAELAKAIEESIVIFESADEFDPEKVKALACIFLDDEPLEAATEADLIAAAAQTENKNVVLTGDITVSQSIDLSALNIESDGYEIVAASQDVVITL